MPKRLIYERILRFSAPILPLLAQDCGHFAPETEPIGHGG
jgi:hypothetical protein